MSVFQYSALDAQGVEVKDEIEALSQKEAISKIRNMGYFPTKVRASGAAKKPGARAGARPAKRRGATGRIKVKAITQFARQLSTLQDAGLPILRSLRILKSSKSRGHSRGLLATFRTTSKEARLFRRHWAGTRGPLIGCWSVWWRRAKPVVCLT